MTFRYCAGQALPGGEMRAKELAGSELGTVFTGDETLVPGTFNVGLMDPITLGEPDIEVGPYRLWECRVATPEMVKADQPGHVGWLLRVVSEDLPLTFVEVIAPIHLRTAMNRQNWPAFAVEIALYCGEGA